MRGEGARDDARRKTARILRIDEVVRSWLSRGMRASAARPLLNLSGEDLMKPVPVAIVVAVILALLWWFWPRDKPASSAASDASKATVASTPAPGAGASAASSGADASTNAASSGASSSAGAAGAASTQAAAAPAAAPKVEAPLTATVYFDFDRSALRAGDATALDDLVARLKDRNYASVTVRGYADRIGEAPHNDALSRKRAEAAVAYLTSKGVDAKKSHAEAKGESEPVTGDACKGLGPEDSHNAKLIDCLQKDRRAVVDVAG